MKALCSGCSVLPFANPSTVRIGLPCACTANIRQDRTASPPTITVQAPQTPCSQPMCVPVRPQSSRMASTRVLRGSTRTEWSRPLMRSLRSTLSVIALSLRQLVAELGANQILDLLAGAHHDRERIAAAERLAGIDDDAGVARITLTISHRVERRRPAAAQNLHALARIAARAHRPDHLVHVGRIDVLIHHHDEAIDVSAGV